MSETESQGREGLSRRFDPRYSPAFQPGYDPRVHRETPRSAPLRDEPVRDWPESRRDAPGAAREMLEIRDDLSIFALPEESATEPDEVAVEEVEPAPWWRRINPWFIALWAIGVVFILAGVRLVSSVEALSRGPQGFGDGGFFVSMLIQMSWIGVPILIGLGLATITSTVVIMAARWRR